MRNSVAVFVAVSLLALSAGAVAQPPADTDADRLIAAPSLTADGRWGANRMSPESAAPQRWEMDVNNRDGVLEGTVTISGSPLLTTGRLNGRVEGRAVWGTIRDEKGREVATFTGATTADGRLHGRYEDRMGGIGTWEWDRPAGEPPIGGN